MVFYVPVYWRARVSTSRSLVNEAFSTPEAGSISFDARRRSMNEATYPVAFVAEPFIAKLLQERPKNNVEQVNV